MESLGEYPSMQYFSYFTLLRLSFLQSICFFIINNLSQKEKRVALTTKNKRLTSARLFFGNSLIYIFLTNKFGLYLKCCFNLNEKSHDGKTIVFNPNGKNTRQLAGEFSPHKTRGSPSLNSSWVFTNSRSFFIKSQIQLFV